MSFHTCWCSAELKVLTAKRSVSFCRCLIFQCSSLLCCSSASTRLYRSHELAPSKKTAARLTNPTALLVIASPPLQHSPDSLNPSTEGQQPIHHIDCHTDHQVRLQLGMPGQVGVDGCQVTQHLFQHLLIHPDLLLVIRLACARLWAIKTLPSIHQVGLRQLGR